MDSCNEAARANALGLLRMVKVFQPDFDMPVSLQNLSWAILDEDSYDDGVCARAKTTCKRIESEAKLAQSIMRDHLSIAPSETVDAASFAGVLLQVVAIFACASYLMVVQRRVDSIYAASIVACTFVRWRARVLLKMSTLLYFISLRRV